MVAKCNSFLFHVISKLGEKNPAFLKEFVNDIRLLIGDHEYIKIVEIKI